MDIPLGGPIDATVLEIAMSSGTVVTIALNVITIPIHYQKEV